MGKLELKEGRTPEKTNRVMVLLAVIAITLLLLLVTVCGILIWVIIRSDVPVRVLILAYLLPLAAAIALGYHSLKRLWKSQTDEEKNEKVNYFTEQLKKDRSSTGPLGSLFIFTLLWSHLVFVGPIMAINLVLIQKLKSRFINTTDFTFVWSLAAVGFAFWLELSGHPSLSVSISVFAISSAFAVVTSVFRREKGVMELFKRKDAPLSPTNVLTSALIIAIAFGCLYFHLSHQEPDAFSVNLGSFDAIYFSIVTFATVGYGDIVPVSRMAKSVCCLEIVIGIILLVLAINTMLPVWLHKHLDATPKTEDPVAPKTTDGGAVAGP